MFLVDIAEFGRRVKLSTPPVTYIDGSDTRHTTRNYIPGKSSINKNAVTGSDTIITALPNNDKRHRYRQHSTSSTGKKSRSIIKRQYYDEYNIYDGVDVGRRPTNFIENKKTGKKIYRKPKPSKNSLENYEKQSTNPKPFSTATATPSPTPKVNNTSNTTIKSSRKLVNKYTLGAAGILGAGAVGYGAYKLANRKKDDKRGKR